MTEPQTKRILRALLRAAKTAPKPDTAIAELGFETRLLATIRERAGASELPWLMWNRWVWRLAPVLAAVVIALACWEFFGANGSASWALWGDPLGLELALAEQLGGGL
jgi:hypothetical protein